MISYRHIQLCHGLHYGVTALVIDVLVIYWTRSCDFLVISTMSHLNTKQTCPGNPTVSEHPYAPRTSVHFLEARVLLYHKHILLQKFHWNWVNVWSVWLWTSTLQPTSFWLA
jgi:hypothetical protein